MRNENQKMQEWLRSHAIRARVRRVWGGSLGGTWRLYEPMTRWTEEMADRLNGLGFTGFDGRPLGPYSGNGGIFSVFVRGHDEMAEGSMDRKSAARELERLAREVVSVVDPAVQEMIERALPDLERKLKIILGYTPRLEAERSGSDWVSYEEEVGPSAMGVFSAVFSEASVVVVVTMSPLGDGSYMARVEMKWESHRGGRNGGEVATAWFYPDKGTWTVETRWS